MDKQLLERLDEALGELESALDSAETNRSDGYDATVSAQEAADSAQNYAYDAQCEFDRLENDLGELRTQYDVLCALVEELRNAGKGSLGGDIAKWTPKVMYEHKRGLSVAQIAARFEISEFLVNQVIKTAAEKAA